MIRYVLQPVLRAADQVVLAIRQQFHEVRRIPGDAHHKVAVLGGVGLRRAERLRRLEVVKNFLRFVHREPAGLKVFFQERPCVLVNTPE